jgi:hypothetical protein
MGATAHDLTSVHPFDTPIPAYPFGLGGFYTPAWIIDLAALKASQAWTIDGSSGDYIFIAPIPIGAQIHGVLMNVLTACTDTGTATVSVGDYLVSSGAEVDADGYMAATSIKATGYTGTVIGDAYGAATKAYSAAHYLALTFGGTEADIKTGKFWIAVKMSLMSFPDLTIVAPSTWH